MNISICMATFNGENYINEQLDTILPQLDSDDEMIIVDDYSSDNTVKAIEYYKDSRVKIYQNDKNMGHVFSFNKAIFLSKNEIIFLSDQDNIWIEGRVDLMKNSLIKSGALLVATNLMLLHEDKDLIEEKKILKPFDSSNHLINIFYILTGGGKRLNYGCTMAFKRKLLEIVLPIPSFVELHDLWLALASNIMRSNLHIEEMTIKRRNYGNNLTNVNRSLFKKMW